MPEDRLAAAADAIERFECALDGHRLLGHSNQCGKGTSGEFLAIAAMADRCARRVRLGCVTHRAAEATAFDLHVDPLALLAFRLKAEGMLPIRRARPMAKTNFVVTPGAGAKDRRVSRSRLSASRPRL